MTANLTNQSGAIVADRIDCQGIYRPIRFHFPAGLVLAKSATFSQAPQGPPTPVMVGDGTNPANYVMQGGTHTFNDGLIIASNSVFAGCGTVAGSVTNLGTILVGDGCDVIFSNSVFNRGTIIATNGAVHFLAPFLNDGTLIANSTIIALRAPGLAARPNPVRFRV